MRVDRAQGPFQIALEHLVRADIRRIPRHQLGVKISRRRRAEATLPIRAKESVQVRRAEAGLRTPRKMQIGAVEILTERPRGINAAKRALGGARLAGKPPIADMLRRR